MDESQKQIETNKKKQQKKIALLIFTLAVIGGILASFFYVQYGKTHITTDDAFIEGTIHIISSKIPGSVVKIYVSDNQFVHKGDILLELDKAIYEQAFIQARSFLKAEEKRLEEIKASMKAQEKNIVLRKASLDKAIKGKGSLKALVRAREEEVKAKHALLEKAEKDLARMKKLYKEGVISDEKMDMADTAYKTAFAALKASEALLEEARVSLKNQDPVIKEARAAYLAEKENLKRLLTSFKAQQHIIASRKAQMEIARLKLSYTRIYAPSNGYVTKKIVSEGTQIQAGQPIMSIVPLDDIYVVANYKETKIHRIKPGQKVRIKVDAFPGKVFTGRVHSIMAGTGAVFSLFPPENATGNYVKVVQRIPVKILLDKDTDPDHILRIGMSVIPTVLANE